MATSNGGRPLRPQKGLIGATGWVRALEEECETADIPTLFAAYPEY